MLRITRKANGEVVLKISGQLNAENVAEVRALIAAESKGRRIVLDCADLRSVDGEAVKFLEKWGSGLDQAEELRPLHPRVDQERAVWKENRTRVRINKQQTGPAELSL